MSRNKCLYSLIILFLLCVPVNLMAQKATPVQKGVPPPLKNVKIQARVVGTGGVPLIGLGEVKKK